MGQGVLTHRLDVHPGTLKQSELTRDQNLQMGESILGQVHPAMEKSKLRYVVRILAEVKNKDRLADVGCFDGSLSAEFLKCGFKRVDGYDVSKAALERAAERGIATAEWDFESEPAPVPDSTFDALVCADVVEHVFNTQNLVKECRRILKPGGLAVFLVPNLASLHNRLLVIRGKMPMGSPGVSVAYKSEAQVNLGHARLGTLKEWAGLLTSEGFAVESESGIWTGRFSRLVSFSRPSLAHTIVRV